MEAQADMTTQSGGTRKELIEPVLQSELYEEFCAAFDQANKNNPRPADVERLRAILRDNEDAELWRTICGVTGAAEAALLSHDSLSPALRECWQLRMDNLRDELGYEDAPPIEKLLISHSVVCWLRLNLLEIFNGRILNQEMTLTKAEFWEKRLVLAQRRFTRAVETLAKVRTLTAATRLIESRTESAVKRVNHLRTVKALTA